MSAHAWAPTFWLAGLPLLSGGVMLVEAVIRPPGDVHRAPAPAAEDVGETRRFPSLLPVCPRTPEPGSSVSGSSRSLRDSVDTEVESRADADDLAVPEIEHFNGRFDRLADLGDRTYVELIAVRTVGDFAWLMRLSASEQDDVQDVVAEMRLRIARVLGLTERQARFYLAHDRERLQSEDDSRREQMEARLPVTHAERRALEAEGSRRLWHLVVVGPQREKWARRLDVGPLFGRRDRNWIEPNSPCPWE